METRVQYFDCLCRTCMNKVEASSQDGTTIPQKQLLSIFDIFDECGALRIAELLSEAVPQIVVQPSDELPKKICTECLQRLLSVHRFQQMCVQSDKKMHELLSKEQTVLKTPMLEGAIKGGTKINEADSQPLKELRCSSTLQNLQQPSIQLAEVTVQTIEPEAAQSSADDHLQDNTQLLEQCMDAQGEFEEFIKNEPNEGDKATTHLKTLVLEEAIKGATETNDADSQPLKELRCSSTLQNLQQPSIQEPLAEVTVQTIEPEAAQSSAANHLQDNTQLLEYCNNSQGEFEEFIKNEPIEDEEANSEYSDGNTMHSIISVTKEEVLPIEFEDEQVNDAIPAEQRTTLAEDKPYECPYCPLRFNSKRNVSTHKVIHEGIKPHKCGICGKKFRRNSDLMRHKRIHSKEKPLKCDICEKQFTEMQGLKIHIRTHTGERPYKCKYCEHRFISTSSMHIHLRSHLGINMYRCKFCPIAFPLGSEMRLHLLTHKNEDPEVRERNLKALQEEEAKLKLKFSKEKTKGQLTEEQQQEKFCNKEIEQQSTDIIAEQRTTQTENKPYECPYCPLRFSSRGCASTHKTIHEGIKPHKCGICGKKFRRKSDLMRHKRIHSNEKPHKCDQCEKQFIQMQDLKVHIRKHTGEKPYKCKYCERAFAERGTLRYHLRSHLGKNIHRCKFCPLAFSSFEEMRLHLFTHKNEDPEVRERNLKALQEEEAKLKLKFSKEISKGQSTEEQQQEKLSDKDIEQPSRE